MSRGKSLAYKPGAGEGRDYWAIKQWLNANKITLNDIALAEGVTPAIVSQTIRGTRNTRRVIKQMLTMGCPAEIINLPEDLKALV
jgi:phage portal protein BeeE